MTDELAKFHASVREMLEQERRRALKVVEHHEMSLAEAREWVEFLEGELMELEIGARGS